MKAAVFIFTFLVFGNLAFGSSQASSVDNSIIEVSSVEELAFDSDQGKRNVNNFAIRCPKDETRSYRSGKYLIYERCAENGRWVNAGTRRIKINY